MKRFYVALVGFLLTDAVPLIPSKSLSAQNAGAASGVQSLPLSFAQGAENLLWTVDVKIGSQQKFNLTLDINGKNSFLFLDRLQIRNTKECGRDNGARRFFDDELSSTYEGSVAGFDGGMGRYPYLSLSCREQEPDLVSAGIEAWYSTDTFHFGAFSAQKTPFVVVREVYLPLNPQWPSDGILGLNDYSEPLSTTSKILKGFDKQEITLYFKSDLNAGGQITFGGRDTQNCGKSWTTFKRREYWGWGAYVPNLTLGSSKVIDFGHNASLSTNAPFLELPFDVFEPLVRTLRAEYDFATDLYTVGCDKVSSMPSLGIRLRDPLNPTKDAIHYEVPSSKYTIEMKTSTGRKCALLVVEEMDGSKLGTQFLPPGCIHLDYANDAVSFDATM
ncbi:CBN-ASP-1 protein [Aphelenchoides avenae]|nr:CBN-ASP-1 protein [Aphelenchus avenae]